jgi:citrate lyase subunit beta/citryl-CoA lyase
MQSMILRRSVLYVPANKPRALEKSRSLPADCVIYDLEDSIGPTAKAAARDDLVTFLARAKSNDQERVVRINSLGSGWAEADVQAIKECAVDAVLLPKIRTAEDIHAYRGLFGAAAETSPAFWVMLETAAGILNLREIVLADAAICVLVLGLEDLALETAIRRTPSRNGFQPILSTAVLTARAHGLDVVDGVFTQLDDEAGFQAECQQGVDLGFDGKSLIHPKQIEVCNRCFSPSEDEFRQAQSVVNAWEQQSALGLSVIVVEGRMVEQLHANQARRILARAAAAARS